MNKKLCEFALNKNGCIEKYTCDTWFHIFPKLKKQFREENKTDEIIAKGGKDRAYIEFCKDLDEIMDNCPHNHIEETCSKCSPEEHENGGFCRCEGRNIRLAKQKRKESKPT